MKTLDDVVSELEKHSVEFEKHTSELEKHTQIRDDLVKTTDQISSSQAAMTSAVTLLVTQLSDRKALEARVARIEEELRQLRGTH